MSAWCSEGIEGRARLGLRSVEGGEMVRPIGLTVIGWPSFSELLEIVVRGLGGCLGR
jgi:hypothetical protein